VGQGLEGIEYTELPSSPTWDVGPEGAVGKRRLRVSWDDAHEAAKKLVGYAEVSVAGSPPAGSMSRWLPAAFPKWYAQYPVGYPTMYATRVSGEVQRWRYCVLSVTYEAVPYMVLPDDPGEDDESYRFVSKTGKAAAKALSLSGTDLLWDDAALPTPPNGSAVGVNTTKLELQPLFTLTWHRVPAAAIASQIIQPGMNTAEAYLDSLVGSTNLAAFRGYSAQTLQMYPPEYTQKNDPFVLDLYDVAIPFGWAPQGQNKLWYRGTGAVAAGYFQVKANSGGTTKRVYDVSDWSKLFTIPVP
jgi:hypothetical protein